MKKLHDIVMWVSLEERTKRRNAKLHKEKIRLEGLSDEELLFEYVDLSALYEYQKRFFSLLLVTALIAGIADIWRVFASFVYKALEQAVARGVCTEADMAALLTMVFFICVLSFAAVFVITVCHLKAMCTTHRSLIMAREIEYEKSAKRGKRT